MTGPGPAVLTQVFIVSKGLEPEARDVLKTVEVRNAPGLFSQASGPRLVDQGACGSFQNSQSGHWHPASSGHLSMKWPRRILTYCPGGL